MSIVITDIENNEYKGSTLRNNDDLTIQDLKNNKYEASEYSPSEEEKETRALILKHMILGNMNMWTPRVEFNDLSTIQRMQVDQMSWNAYQANNGQPASYDDIQGWRSNAMRPIVRNKAVSIAAHATARLIFPKVFANNEANDDERDAAQVMEDLMEWSGDQSNYKYNALVRTITALTDPVSIGYTEYAETYRRVKTKKNGKKWEYKTMLDATLSGFQDVTVPTDELYIENFYEPDIQKQAWLIWRRVISYDLAKAKYGSLYENFKYVREGVQTIYSDANQSFYYVYDPNMRQYDVEEIIYWNKSLDVKIIMVNGVILTEYDNPNPRIDKKYPFEKFGYELINNRCFYYKSLAFKMMQDANIINTLYPMIIDGTYLKIMPPMINRGGEAIASDVIVPGAVTTLSSPDANLQAINTGDIRDSFMTLSKVEESINQTSQDPIASGQQPQGTSTAYEISRLEQNSATVLGLFIQMISKHVKDFGELRISDILQYLTIADTASISGNKELTYKTFLLRDKQVEGKTRSRKIMFDAQMPDEAVDNETQMNMSYDIMKEEGGIDSKTELYKVNPALFRNLQYTASISPDILNPRSEDLERAYGLEFYDRAIANPKADQEEVYRRLLQTDPVAKKNPDKYISQEQIPTQITDTITAKQSPLASMMGNLPKQPTL
jgi:hypothetical protein